MVLATNNHVVLSVLFNTQTIFKYIPQFPTGEVEKM